MTWTIEGQEPWYVEHPTSPSVTSVGIAKDGVIKAVAVSTTLEDEGDYIVAALNAYEAESPRHHVVGSEQAIAIIEARLPLYTDIGQINALKECISSIRGASPQHVVGSEASEIERLTAERDELQKAIDSAEIEAGITSNGNLWRFWSWRSKELAVKFTKVTAERDRFRAALDKISSPTQTTDLLWWQVEARAALASASEGSADA